MKRFFQTVTHAPVALSLAAIITLLLAVAGVVRMVETDLEQQSRLVNVSARGPAGTGPEAMLVGFVVSDFPQTVLVRGLGPSLAKAGTANAIPELVLRVVRHADGTDVGRNERWRGPGNERLWGDLKHLAPAEANDAACVLKLAPGGYSVLIEGRNGAKGIASIEIFVIKE